MSECDWPRCRGERLGKPELTYHSEDGPIHFCSSDCADAYCENYLEIPASDMRRWVDSQLFARGGM